jgi:hypothetical protein
VGARARNLVEAGRTLVVGIPVTSVARTILDLAWKLRGDQPARVLAQAEDLSFEGDRTCDLALALAGIETIRVSELQFRREPNAIAAEVATLVARRSLDASAAA